ncbi:MAG: OmpA family protein, partial [Saprospiraceae bacterium]|nr:OmpA family protein [Saprospiraceae bacterium]
TGEQVRLTGHTDNIGDDEFNQKLGMQRAQAIEQLLLEKGVPAEQIVVESKGRSQPVAPNDTEAGRRENRRVEVRFIKKN